MLCLRSALTPPLVVLVLVGVVAQLVVVADALGALRQHSIGVRGMCGADYQRVPALLKCQRVTAQSRRASERGRCAHLSASWPCVVEVLGGGAALVAPHTVMMNFTTTRVWQRSARLPLVQGPGGAPSTRCSRARQVAALLVDRLPLVAAAYSPNAVAPARHARRPDARIVVITVAFTYDIWAAELLVQVVAVNVLAVEQLDQLGVSTSPRTLTGGHAPVAIQSCSPPRHTSRSSSSWSPSRPCAESLRVSFEQLGEQPDVGCLGSPDPPPRVLTFANRGMRSVLHNEDNPAIRASIAAQLPDVNHFLSRALAPVKAPPLSCACTCERTLVGLPEVLQIAAEPFKPSHTHTASNSNKLYRKHRSRYDDIE
jgi:hypothetical protein